MVLVVIIVMETLAIVLNILYFPKAWTDQILAEIRKDEDTFPHDLLLWEAM